MSSRIIPVQIKPHLVPFMVKKFKYVDCDYLGKKAKAVKITTHTNLGKYIRLLVDKSTKKHVCKESPQILLLIQERTKISEDLSAAHQYEDLRYSFCEITHANQLLINDYLEDQFETAMMYTIKAWCDKLGKGGMSEGIIRFIYDYNLEEFGFSEMQIRQAYYRKSKRNYFESKAYFDPVKKSVVAF